MRDALLHHEHREPWGDLPDLDFVVEGSAPDLADALWRHCGAERISNLRVHAAYGTVEMVLDGVLLDLAGRMCVRERGRWRRAAPRAMCHVHASRAVTV